MSLERFAWVDDGELAEMPAESLPSHWRPRTRKDCETAPRPCPYLGCRHHLAIHVDGESISHSGGRSRGAKTIGKRLKRGTTVEGWSDDVLDVLDAMPKTCALDVAAEGATTLDDIGGLLGVSRERVRQIEEAGLVKLRKRIGADGLGELLDAIASSPHRESALQEAQGHVSILPGDVAAMREAKG